MELVNSSFHQFFFFFLIDHTVFRNRGKICERNIFLNTFFQHQPFHFSVFRNKSNPLLDCLNRRFNFHFFPFYFNLSGIIWKVSKNCLHDFRSSGSHKTRNTENLSSAHFKAHIPEHTFFRQSIHLQHRSSYFTIPLRITFSDLSTNHQFHNFVHIRFRNFSGSHISTIPQNADAITEFKDFFHSMRNIYNGYACFTE